MALASPTLCSVLFLNSDRSRHPPHPTLWLGATCFCAAVSFLEVLAACDVRSRRATAATGWAPRLTVLVSIGVRASLLALIGGNYAWARGGPTTRPPLHLSFLPSRRPLFRTRTAKSVGRSVLQRTQYLNVSRYTPYVTAAARPEKTVGRSRLLCALRGIRVGDLVKN